MFSREHQNQTGKSHQPDMHISFISVSKGFIIGAHQNLTPPILANSNKQKDVLKSASARCYSGETLNTLCVPNPLGVRVCPPSQLESCGNPTITMSKGDNLIQVQCRHCLYGEDICRKESVGKFIA